MQAKLFTILLAVIAIAVGENTTYDDHTWRCLNISYDKDGEEKRRWYMRYADNLDGVKPYDLWFDRLIFIHHTGDYDTKNKRKNPSIEDMHLTISGVIITKRHVLTSLNPFRDIIRFRFKRAFTFVCVLTARRYKSLKDNRNLYQANEFGIVCARPVIPLSEEQIPLDLWHGYDHYEKMHTPLHDLLVVRIHMDFQDMLPDNPYTTPDIWTNDPNDRTAVYHVGPIMTELALESDILGRKMKFGMTGMKNGISYRDMYVREYEPDENVETDCDEWFPREWGHFICLRNLDNIKRFGSGAMLYSDRKLFGVGSFALFKGEQSVLVFTDIRKYRSLIFNTCTEEDQSLVRPRIDL